MEKLLLIDGNAIVHRAYHALPPLHSHKGKPTNAVYGFFAMVLKVINDLKPTYIVVCFDREAPTFRKQMYVGYQAQRPKMEDELSSQFVLIHDILLQSKFKIFEVDGFEADDLIGTISNQAKEEVIILSGDRDLLQLVNGHVRMIAPITGVTKMILFDKAAVVEKYGLQPEQIPDYKALVGDASDNYPGVMGIGPKTASDLISRFKNIENIYNNLGEIAPKVSEKLATDAEQAALAKKLATIDVNSPIKYKNTECKAADINEKGILENFKMLKFNSLIQRFNLEKADEITEIKEEFKPSVLKKKEENQLELL